MAAMAESAKDPEWCMNHVYVGHTAKYTYPKGRGRQGRRTFSTFQGVFKLKSSFVKMLGMDPNRIKKKKGFKKLNIGYYYGATLEELEEAKQEAKIKVIEKMRRMIKNRKRYGFSLLLLAKGRLKARHAYSKKKYRRRIEEWSAHVLSDDPYDSYDEEEADQGSSDSACYV
jgi:hypothetical protein